MQVSSVLTGIPQPVTAELCPKSIVYLVMDQLKNINVKGVGSGRFFYVFFDKVIRVACMYPLPLTPKYGYLL